MQPGTVDRFVSQTPVLMKSYTTDGKGPLPKRLSYARVKATVDMAVEGKAGHPRVFIITGLRGVGKTTLLFQIMQDMHDGGWASDRLLYLPMDQALLGGKNIHDLVLEYEREVVREYIAKTEGKFAFFIDEAQFSPGWDLQVKVLSDSMPNAIFLVSGSSAVQMDMSADLARRALTHVLHPLSMLEQLLLSDRATIDPGVLDGFADCLFGSKNAEDLMGRYATSSKPIAKVLREHGGLDPGAYERFLLEGGMPWPAVGCGRYQRTYDIVERIVEKDLPQLGEHDPKTLRALPRILSLIAPSPDISLNSISNDLDSVGMTSIRRVLDTLVKSQLIFEVPRLGSLRSSGRGETRKYYASAGLAAAVIDTAGFDAKAHLGPLAECAVASTLKRRIAQDPGSGLFFVPGKGQADLVLQHGKRRIVIEVGMGRKDDGFKQVMHSLSEAKADYGIIVSDAGGLEQRGKVVRVPMREFLCL